VKLKVKVTLAQVMKAQRGSIGKFYLFFNLGVKWGWVIDNTTQPLFPQERDPL
jgi:hypothetical protein